MCAGVAVSTLTHRVRTTYSCARREREPADQPRNKQSKRAPDYMRSESLK